MIKDNDWRLVHAKTGEPVSEGDELPDFRGYRWVIGGGRHPNGHGSGRVYTTAPHSQEFYPSVFNLEWVK
jgi:hypothetical protein